MCVFTSWKPLWGSSRTLQAAKCSAQPDRAPFPHILAVAHCGKSEPPDLGWNRRRTACPSHLPGRSGKPGFAGVDRGGFPGLMWAITALYTVQFSHSLALPPATHPRSYPTLQILLWGCQGWTHYHQVPTGAVYWECWLLHWGCWFSPGGNAGSYGIPTPGSKSASLSANWFGPFWSSAAVPPIPPLQVPFITPLHIFISNKGWL